MLEGNLDAPPNLKQTLPRDAAHVGKRVARRSHALVVLVTTHFDIVRVPQCPLLSSQFFADRVCIAATLVQKQLES